MIMCPPPQSSSFFSSFFSPCSYLRPLLSRYPPSAMPLETKRLSLDSTEVLLAPWRCHRFKKRLKDIDGERQMEQKRCLRIV